MDPGNNRVDISNPFKRYVGPRGPLRHRCPLCPASGDGSGLLRCTACLAVRYCSREHAVAHRPQHKSACNKIKKARAKLADEETLVRQWPLQNAFQTHVGRFWDFLPTRGYLQARFTLIRDHLLIFGTLDSITEALEHGRDLLRLSNEDTLQVRNLMPALMLRLDLDQECYDFVRNWAYYGPRGTQDRPDPRLLLGDLKGANVLEEPEFLMDISSNLHFIVAIILLKMKLLVDALSIKATRKVLRNRLPLELLDHVETFVLRSPISPKLFLRKSDFDLAKIRFKLIYHIQRLGNNLWEVDDDFSMHLFYPHEALDTKTHPEFLPESQRALRYSYAAFSETEGVLPLLWDARECLLQCHSNEAIRRRRFLTSQENMPDLNDVWVFLHHAMLNATYFGPWSERPSELAIRDGREDWKPAMEVEAEKEEHKTWPCYGKHDHDHDHDHLDDDEDDEEDDNDSTLSLEEWRSRINPQDRENNKEFYDFAERLLFAGEGEGQFFY
ncbi:hypothetical protein GGS20DRAFT_437974 [Poronia punctata]|nr:hypothetical protein GGS20DRAFT_437974 [Poronia punctata]